MEIKKFEKRTTIKELHLSDDDVKLLTKLADTASKVCSINKATNTECLDCLLQDTFLCHMRNMKKDHIYPLIKEEKIVEIPPKENIPEPQIIRGLIRQELLKYRDICRLSNITCSNCKLKNLCSSIRIANNPGKNNLLPDTKIKSVLYVANQLCKSLHDCRLCYLKVTKNKQLLCPLASKPSSWSDDDIDNISLIVSYRFTVDSAGNLLYKPKKENATEWRCTYGRLRMKSSDYCESCPFHERVTDDKK